MDGYKKWLKREVSMFKKLAAVVTALTLVPSIAASHTANFQSYSLTINNNSGGVLDIKKARGLSISGISRSVDLLDGQSVKAMVKHRNSMIQVVAGPENQKTVRTVQIHNKMLGSHAPSITFNEKGASTSGFYTQEKPYSVTINNRSGGIAQILDTSEATGKGTMIAPMKSAYITVKPNANILIEMGPEKRKLTYKIHFADQSGRNPTITLMRRNFTSNGIHATDVQIQSRRASTINMRPRLASRVTRRNLDTVVVAKKTNRYNRRTVAPKVDLSSNGDNGNGEMTTRKVRNNNGLIN
jgi:hypothetical protein